MSTPVSVGAGVCVSAGPAQRQDDLRSLTDSAFREAWRRLNDEERSIFGEEGFARYKKLTPWVDKSIENLRRQQQDAAPQPVEIDAGALLDAIYAFIGRFVLNPSVEARIAHTLWIAHTHLMDSWNRRLALRFCHLSLGRERRAR